MPRRLNQITIEPGSKCDHCDREFERPYERMPEMEGTSGRVVLKCQYCGLCSVFQEFERGGHV